MKLILSRLARALARRVQRGFIINPFRFGVAAAAAAAPTDPYFEKNVLLLHGEGTNGGTTVTDVMGSSMTVGSGATTSTAQFKFGASSMSFNGTGINTGGGYLDTPSSGVFAPGTGDFTIEGWWYFNNVTPGTAAVLFDTRPANTVTVNLELYVNPSSVLLAYLNGADRITGPTLATGRWYHIALCRASGSTRMFVNGAQVGSTYADTNNYADTRLRICGSGYSTSPDGQYGFNGYLDDFRFTKGVARYTGNFLLPTAAHPDVPTDPYQDNVPVLLHMNGTNGSTTFTDVKGNTFTVGGNAQISTAQSKFGGSSGLFDGNTDYLYCNLPTTPIGAGDFTVECWAYRLGAPDTDWHIFSIVNAADNAASCFIGNSSATENEVRFVVGNETSNNVDIATSAGSFPTNQWIHIACTVSGTTARIFLNGALAQSGTLSGSRAATNTRLVIATLFRTASYGGGTRNFNGYLQDFRITKGVARYTSNFRPPAAALPDTSWDPYWSSVISGLHFDGTNGATTTSCVKGQTYTLHNGAALSTATKKWGSAALALDGTNDYITAPDSADFNFGAGDFTLECWVRPAAFANNVDLITKRSAFTYGPFSLYLQTDGRMRLLSSGDGANWGVDITAAAGALTANTWAHVAATRSGNVWTVWVNGVSQATTTVSHTVMTNATAVSVGAQANGANPFNGHIDDVRITKGVARYTASFTPPIAAFPEPSAYDPYRRFVTALLPFDGATASTAIGEITGKTVTVVGNAQLSTAQSTWGGSSLLLDGAGDYITIPDSADVTFGARNFTVEAWIRPNAYHGGNAGSYAFGIVSKDLNSSREFTLNLVGTASSFTSLQFAGFVNNSTPTTITGAFTFSLNTWYHVAASRVGNTLYLFVNGALVGSGAFNLTIQDGTQSVSIGRSGYDATYTYYFSGNIDDVRITNGVGRYTATFTPPARAFEDV
jgi:hypothetical protein